MTVSLVSRLAAIVFADVVGYSRLMGEDSVGTLAALRQLRGECLMPAVAAHRGDIVKSMGDGWLIEFASVVDAVNCAIQVQEQLAARPTIKLRIGLHLGDITHAEEDIFGDGVNIAARLQDVAEPGTIIISDLAWRSIDRKLAGSFSDLGVMQLKNIAEPLRAYGWGVPVGAARSRASETSRKPSLAILPFANMSNDPEQEYFVDGIIEDLISEFSRIPDLTVIARNSVFAFKGKTVNVQETCRELGVRYVLEGSVRKAGERVRISARLIDGTSSGHLWSDRYDRSLEDVFALQDDVTGKIVSALEVRFAADAGNGGQHAATHNSEAYDTVLRAREQYRLYTKQTNAVARKLYERAIDLDPEYAEPYAGLAETYIQDWFMGSDPGLDRAYELAQQASSRDPALPLVQEALSTVYLFRKQHEEAVATARNWITLEPGNAEAYAALAGALHYSGDNLEVIQLIERAIRLNPIYPFYYPHYMGMANCMMRRFEEAIPLLQRAIKRNPDDVWPHVVLAACYGHLQRDQEAADQKLEILRTNPSFSVRRLENLLPYQREADRELLFDGLKSAAITE